jgi:NAD(P)-dependent dehydrogenase (short-subunit alcohol dehydrogenase family)
VGVGLETTRALAGAGATVIVPARTRDKARAALAGMDRVELESVELSDPTSVDSFAARFLASGRPLHLLVNNAGIMAIPLARTPRGFELQLATNHLGHFQLTARLWPALVKANGARVVALTSRGHAFASVDLEDPSFERRPYDKWKATASQRARTRYSPLRWTPAVRSAACGRSRCTPESSPRSWHGASRRKSSAPSWRVAP